MNTDTPRTDAATFDIEIIGDARTKRHNYPDGHGDVVDTDFARTLERENIALAKDRDNWKDLAEIQQVTIDNQKAAIAQLRAEVEKAWREGYEDRTSFRQLESDDWNRSRAKQVAEGKIPLDVAE